MKPYLSIILFLLLTHPAPLHAQTLGWADIFKSKIKNSNTVVWDMKADLDGNLIACGSYYLGTTLNNKPLPNANTGFLAKFDTAGNLLWFLYGTNELNTIFHIEIGKQGGYFFYGELNYSTYKQPFASLNPMTLNTGAFIGKCDGNGHLLWTRQYLDYHPAPGGTTAGINPDFKVDSEDNVYVSAQMPLYPGYLLIDSNTFTSPGGANLIAKFDSSGHPLWINSIVRFAYDPQITIDKSGNTYCLSNFPDNVGFNSVINKYNRSGQLVKRLIFDSTTTKVELRWLATDAFNNIYVVGYYNGTFTLNGKVYTNTTGNNIGFLFKLDSNFNVQWSLFQDTAGFQNLNVNSKTNYIYISGNYRKPFTLGGQSPQNAKSDTSNNFFVAKITQSGQALWIRNTTRSNVNGISSNIEDGCDNFFVAITAFDSLHFDGLNTANSDIGYGNSVIAKFSSNNLGFSLQSNDCRGLSLKNTSDPVYTQFQWYAKDTADTIIGKLIATTRDLNYLFPHKGSYIITLLAIKSGGCTNTVQDTFNVPNPPVAGFAAIDTQGCQYVQFLFSDTSHSDTINFASGQNWYWDFGDGSAPLIYTQTKRPIVSHIYTQSGTYTVRLVYGNGLCTDTFVSQKKVVIIPAPKPGFAVSDTLGCVPLVINVTDGSVGQVSKWIYVVRKIIPLPPSKGDTIRMSAFTYNFTSPGVYMIHQYLTGPTGCVTEDSVMVNVTPVFSITDKMDITDVTVDTDNTVSVKWLPFSGATSYHLYRYTDYDTSTDALLAQTNAITFQDNSIDPGKHSYAYFIKAEDGCGHFTSQGRIGKTIKLLGFENSALLSQLDWTAYKDWPGGVSNYKILREDPGSSYKNIGTTNDTGFEDQQTEDIYGECYRVMASSNDTGLVSFSNVFCFSNAPQIFIPDIFTPNGDTLNDVFAPVCMGIKEWDMTIINRWGEKVYSKTIPLPPLQGGIAKPPVAGWDGTFKGIISPNGIYVYYIKAEDFDGNTIVRQGKIMLQQ